MKVVHVAFECAPIYKTGGLGDVVGSLPIALQESDVETIVVLPGYSWIRRKSHLPKSKVEVWYVEDKSFSPRLKTHDAGASANAYVHFCIGVIRLLKSRNFVPDIIHCHDWHTGFIPYLLKSQNDPFFARTKTILSLHNVGYQGNFAAKLFDKIDNVELSQYIAKHKKISFLKTGIQYADFLATVSPNHAKEIRSGKVNFGLKGLIARKRGRFRGILNGIDIDIWNPRRDRFIPRRYNLNSVRSKKAENKMILQKELGMEQSVDIPLFGFVARLSTQKGLDMLVPLFSGLPRQRIQLVILGKGDKKYEKDILTSIKEIDPRWVEVILKFDERLAHQIYAASDFFLVPSLYEPCGLTQMIAMRYGSVPVVSNVGGLVDTVEHDRTGIVFDELTTEGLREAMERASDLWENKEKYAKIQQSAMRRDFSWKKSAKEYARLYRRVVDL